MTWQLLQQVEVDARERKFISNDDQRVSITESGQRIHAEWPEFPVELIASVRITSLESFVPNGYSQQQLDELDRLTEGWIDDHKAQHNLW